MKVKGNKLQVLDFFERHQPVGIIELMNEFQYTHNYARLKIVRLHRTGLIEPAITEKGEWIPSVKGEKRLKYLREAGEGGRTGAGTGGSGG